MKLVSPDPEYAEAFASWRRDADTIRYNPLAASSTEALRERLAKAGSDLTQLERSESFMWFIELDGNIVGQVNLQSINRMMLTAEVGYMMDPKMRSRGLATEGLKSLVQDVFAKTNLRKLIAYVHEENLASRRVLNKVGFREEGLLREHYLINGKPANEVIYGLLRGEVK